MLSPQGLGTNTCGIAYHTMQPGLPATIVFMHPKYIDYANMGCVHCCILENSDTDPSEAPLLTGSCHIIIEQEKRVM